MSKVPSDPIDFISKEQWITITAIGSIFTYALVNKFKDNIFDPFVDFLLPKGSFDFMKVKISDNSKHDLDFGDFFRETIIWFFMIIFLFILKNLFKFPDIKGGSSGVAII